MTIKSGYIYTISRAWYNQLLMQTIALIHYVCMFARLLYLQIIFPWKWMK